ncbi:MAG: ABC transporter permease [Acidimicrobiia bacterium]|jgi:ABC-2 type transport system permease protein
MSQAFRIEWWKLRRSPVAVTATALMAVMLPLMGLGFFSVAREGGSGALAQKAEALLVGEGWEGYLGAVDQIAAVAMFIGAGVVVAWAFGREHVDRTFSSLFALPVPRSTIAGAKLAVLAAWTMGLSGLVVLMTVITGMLGDVGPVDGQTIVPGLWRLFAVAVSTTVLALTMGLVASVGRGYLPAIGAMIVIVAIAQVSVLFGTGAWFPFAVPGLLAVAGTDGIPTPTFIQIALLPLTAVLGGWLTTIWWKRAQVV